MKLLRLPEKKTTMLRSGINVTEESENESVLVPRDPFLFETELVRMMMILVGGSIFISLNHASKK